MLSKRSQRSQRSLYFENNFFSHFDFSQQKKNIFLSLKIKKITIHILQFFNLISHSSFLVQFYHFLHHSFILLFHNTFIHHSLIKCVNFFDKIYIFLHIFTYIIFFFIQVLFFVYTTYLVVNFFIKLCKIILYKKLISRNWIKLS